MSQHWWTFPPTSTQAIIARLLEAGPNAELRVNKHGDHLTLEAEGGVQALDDDPPPPINDSHIHPP